MADIRIGNKKWAISTGKQSQNVAKSDGLLAYNTTQNNLYKSVIFDSRRLGPKFVKNKSNELEQLSNETAGIDYELDNNGTLRIERSITNRVSYSEDFGDSAYSLTNASVTIEDGLPSPMNDIEHNDSGKTALMPVYKLSNTSSSDSYIRWVDVAQGQRYSVSLFFKKDVSRYVGFKCLNTSSVVALYVYDFDTNTFVTEQRINDSAEGTDKQVNAIAIPYANGWYRLCVNFLSNTGSGIAPSARVRIMAFKDANGNNTDSFQSVFITGLNVCRVSANVPAPFKSYVKGVGAFQTNSQDIVLRIGNVKYMLPKLTENPLRGFSFTMKFKLNSLASGSRFSFHQTGGGSNSKTSVEFELYAMTTANDSATYDGGFGLRIRHNLGSAGVVGFDFINPALNTSTLKTNKEYHIGFTYTSGFLRFSVNGTDANTLTNGSTPATNNTIFAPVLDATSSRQINDIRFCQQASQSQPIPAAIIDYAVYDKSLTQNELNFLTLQ